MTPLSTVDEWTTDVSTITELDRGPFEDCVELGVLYRYEVAATFGDFRTSSQDPGPAWLTARYHQQPLPPTNVTLAAPTLTRPSVLLDWDDVMGETEAAGFGPVSGYAVQFRIDGGSWQDTPYSGTESEYGDSTAWKRQRTSTLEYRVRLRTAITELVMVGANVWASPTTAVTRTGDAMPALTVTAPQSVVQLADTDFPPAQLEWNALADTTVRYQVFRRPIDGSNRPFTVHATNLSDPHFVEGQAQTGDTYEYQVQAYSYTAGGGPLSSTVRLMFVQAPSTPATLPAAAVQVTGLFGSTFRIGGPSELLPSRLHHFQIARTAGQALLGGRQRGVLFNAGDGELARWVDADHLGACTGVLFCPMRPAGTDYGFHPTDGRPSQWLAYWRGIDTATGLRPGDSVQVLVPPEVNAMYTVEFGFGQVAESGAPTWFTDSEGQPTKRDVTIQPFELVAPHSLTASWLSDGRVRLAWMAAPGTYDGFQVQRRPVGGGVDAYEFVCCHLGLDVQELVDAPPTLAPGATSSFEYRVGTFYANGHAGWLDATARVDLGSATVTVAQRPRFADAARNPSLQFAAGMSVDQGLPTATGGDPPLTYQFTDLSAIGLSFDATAHKLVGTAVAGSAHGTLAVQDSDGDRDELWYEITIGDAPSQPRELSAMGGEQTITLSWQPPMTVGSATALAGYRIEYSPDGVAGSWKVLVERNAADATSYTHAGLTGAQTVRYQVAAISVVGIGAYSAPAQAMTVAAVTPPAPASVTATPGFRQVVLHWTPPARDGGAPITGYRLEWSATGTDTDWQQLRVQEPASRRTYTVSNLWGGRVLHFRVAALNRAGTGAYVSTRTTPWVPPQPDAPAAVVATPDTQRILLHWTVPSTVANDPVSGYRIEHSATGAEGSWQILQSNTRSPNPRFTHDGLSPSQTVHYQVAAINFGGVSEFSDSVNATTLVEGVPGAPAGIDAIPYTGSIRVEWGVPSRDGGSEITEYRLQHSATGGDPWAEVIATGSSTHYVHTGLTAGQRVYYRVVAVNVHGAGPSTGIVNQRALNGQPTLAETPDITIQRSRNQTVYAHNWPSDQMPYPTWVTWEYSFDRWSGWQRLNRASGVGGTAFDIEPGVVSHAFRPGRTTYLRMYYSNSAGDGPWMTIRHSHTAETTPDAISNLRAWRGFQAVDLAWDEPFDGGSPITTYRVEHSTDGTDWTATDTGSAVPQHTVAGLADDTEYRVRVAAVNASGAGGNSNEVRIRTVPSSTVPDPPMRLQAELGDGQVDLSWQRPTVTRGATITGFRVEYSADGPAGTWSPVVTTPDADTRTHSHMGLPSAPDLHYRAFSLIEAGESIPSTVVRVADSPPAPQRFAVFGGRDSVLLEWAPPADFLGPPVHSYRVQHDVGDSWREAVPQTGSGATMRLHIQNLAVGQNQRYRVAAINAVGTGDDSSPVTAVISLQRPTPPRTVTALTHGDDVEVRWLPPTTAGEANDRIIGYRVDRSLDGGVSWSTLNANTNDSRTNHIDDNVVPNTDSVYRVFAINSRTHSLSLPSDHATVAIDSAVALPPINVRVAFGFSQNTIQWEEVQAVGGAAVTGYRVEFATAADAADSDWQLLQDVDSAAIVEAAHGSLPAQDAIYYRVATKTAMGNSRYSVPVGGRLRSQAAVLDMDGNGELESNDARVLYYALALGDVLGDGSVTSGFAAMRATLLRDVQAAAGANATDASFRRLLTAATELTVHVESVAFDMNGDNMVTEDDALIMFYAVSFGDLLNHETDGENFRRTFLRPLANADDPSDETLLELMTRANALFGN